MPDEGLENLLCMLPEAVHLEIARLAGGYTDFEGRLSEIRLRAGRVASLVLDGRNLTLRTSLSGTELAALVKTFCHNSVYAYSESLREGYITLTGGYRVGVAGRAVMDGGCVVGVSDITSLVIRLSHRVRGAADVPLQVFEAMGGRQGLLIYSPPGMGKTTILRDLLVRLSSGPSPRRVAVVDSRGELAGSYIGTTCHVDILSGYPKAEGIELATRTLSPEVILCDEIGGFEEVEAVLAMQNSGVPLIATAHGDSPEGILRRSAIRTLVQCRVFGAYVGVRRDPLRGFLHTTGFFDAAGDAATEGGDTEC